METIYQLRQMIEGCLNRICITEDKKEIDNIYTYLKDYYLPRFISLNKKKINNL